MADLSITAASFVPGANAKYEYGVAAQAITIGQLVYRSSADGGKYRLADADASQAASQVAGIAANSASGSGQPLTIITYDDDLTPGATLVLTTVGARGLYMLSATAGGIAPVADLAAGAYPCFVMVAKSTTKAIFNPTFPKGTVTAIS
jgi:hypothetical protein